MGEEEDIENPEECKKEGKAEKRFRWKRWLTLCILGFLPCMALLLCLAWLALPYVVPFIQFPEVTVDLSESMKNTPPGLFPDQTLTVNYGIDHHPDGYRVTAKGRVLGWPFTATAIVDISLKFWGADIAGQAAFRLDGSNLGGTAKFKASVPGGWEADVEMPKTPLADNDPFIKAILARHPEEIVRKIAFDGQLSLAAHAEQERIYRGIPKWQASARVEGLDASLDANGKPLRIDNLRMSFRASGVADHVDIGPMFPRTDCIEGAGCALSNAFASVRATETAFLVTEAGADFCGGNLRLYSFFLDPKKLNAGVTIYMDGIDAGQALSHINGFKGEATGTLNGKFPIRLSNGNEIHLSKGYLHSVPGEKGNLKIYDPTPITDNLKMSGVETDTADNLANALANLDYSALKIGLVPEDDDSMALTMKLEGTATRGDLVVPVSFTVTFHGQLEQLINTGLKVATRKEQKKQ